MVLWGCYVISNVSIETEQRSQKENVQKEEKALLSFSLKLCGSRILRTIWISNVFQVIATATSNKI